MKKITSLLAALLFSLFLFTVSTIPAEAATTASLGYFERIDNYDSNIIIGKDGNLTVTETITVTTPNNSTIRHGIYRDYPLNYSSGFIKTNISINVLQVLRDGKKEDYHTEGLSNGIRYYFGNSDVLLDPGTYTYTFKYTVNRMLGFFQDHDELYYNITGNGWSYEIDKVKATIELPTGIAANQLIVDFYTGPQGSKEQAATKTTTTSGDHQVVTVTTTGKLYAEEGLSVVVAWPKGIVPPPSTLQNAVWLILDNFPLFLGFLVLPFVILYAFALWYLKGRDPRPGTVVPIFNPPADLSPAAMRYIDKMSIDDKGITAAVIHLAVQKRLTINEDKVGIFSSTQYSLIKRSNDYEGLPAEELAYFERILSQSKPVGTELDMSSTHYTKFQSAKSGFESSLEKSYSGSHINGNRIWLAPAYIVAIAYYALLFIFYIATAQTDNDGIFIFALIWNTVLAIFAPILFRVFINKTDSGSAIAGKVVLGCFAMPFLITGFLTLGWVVTISPLSILIIGGVAGSIVALAVATMYMPNRTIKGRKLEDQILGFRMFLNTTERYRIAELIPKLPLNLGNKKQNISEDVVRLKLFELYLPYAIALDIEKKWSEQFAEVLSRNQAETDQYGSWYTGTHMFSSAAFASSLSSGLSGAVSSSGVAPGSSSGGGGFSGGGSSGGGGGGGGGGGW